MAEVKGLRELGLRMRNLSADMAGKVARAAASSAAQIVRKAARANAAKHKKTGNLDAAIRVAKVKRTRLSAQYIVGVRSGSRSEIEGGTTADVKAAKAGTGPLGIDAFYYQFLELGTVFQPPRPFLRPALEQNTDAATQAMAKRLRARLDKAGA